VQGEAISPNADGRPASLTLGPLLQVLNTGADLKGRPPFVPFAEFTTRTEAEAEAGRLRTAIRNGAFTAPAPSQQPEVPPETRESYAREWLRIAPSGLLASTIRFDTDHVENHIFPLLGSRPIAEMKRSDVKALIVALRAKKLRPTTIGGIVRTLSTILWEAVDARAPHEGRGAPTRPHR
jgi:hypothetical protein